MKTPTIAINTFANRHTAASPFSHFEGTDSVLIELAQAQFHQAKPGYKEGVVLVPVPVQGFFSSIVPITEANASKVITVFEQRREGEEFYLAHRIKGDGKSPAVSVELCMYSHAVLSEDGDATSEADWEIVSINASPTKEPTPQDPISMARNQLHMAGGTKADLDPTAIAEAIDFASRHAMVVDGYKHIRIKKANWNEVRSRLVVADISCAEILREADRHPSTNEEMVYIGVACTGARFHRLIEDIADVVYPASSSKQFLEEFTG